jgi:hypothetical protein
LPLSGESLAEAIVSSLALRVSVSVASNTRRVMPAVPVKVSFFASGRTSMR